MASKSNNKAATSYDTMGQAAGALGLDIALLKKAKDAGCPAFRGSRIYKAELQEWLAKNKEALPTTNKEEAQVLKLLEDYRRLKIANDSKEKLLVLRSKVVASFGAVKKQISPYLEAKLENEYPSAVAYLDVAQARVYGRRVRDSIEAELQKACDLWKI